VNKATIAMLLAGVGLGVAAEDAMAGADIFFGNDNQLIMDFDMDGVIEEGEDEDDQDFLDNTRMTSTPNTDAARQDFINFLNSNIIVFSQEDFDGVATDPVNNPDRPNLSGRVDVDDVPFSTGKNVPDFSVNNGAVERVEGPNAVNPASGPTNDDGRYPRSGNQYLSLLATSDQSDPDNVITFSFSDGTRTGSPGAATAFGFTGIDIGDFGGELLAMVVKQMDGTETTFSIFDSPFTDGDSSGSVLFWGLVDKDNPFTEISLVRAPGDAVDGFAFDNLIIGGEMIPAPMAAGLGLAGLCGVMSRRRRFA